MRNERIVPLLAQINEIDAAGKLLDPWGSNSDWACLVGSFALR